VLKIAISWPRLWIAIVQFFKLYLQFYCKWRTEKYADKIISMLLYSSFCYKPLPFLLSAPHTPHELASGWTLPTWQAVMNGIPYYTHIHTHAHTHTHTHTHIYIYIYTSTRCMDNGQQPSKMWCNESDIINVLQRIYFSLSLYWLKFNFLQFHRMGNTGT